MKSEKRRRTRIWVGLVLAAPLLSLPLALSLFGAARDRDADFPYPYRVSRNAVPAADAEIQFLQKRLSDNADRPLDMAALAGAYLSMGRATGDASCLEKADSLARKSLESLSLFNTGAKLVLAELAEERHDFSEALRIADEILAEKPDSDGALALTVTVGLGMGDVERARQAAERLVERIPTQGALLLRALVHEALGREEEALQDFRAALAVEDVGEYEASAWTRTLLARLHFRYGRYEKARKLCEYALEIRPDSHLALALLADAQAKLGGFEDAERNYALATKISGEPPYMLRHARLKRQLGQDERAEALLEQAEQIVRGEVVGTPFGHRTELAEILLEQGGEENAREAVELARADSQIRRDSRTLLVLARALHASGHAREARAAIRDAMRWGIEDAEIYRLAADIEEAAGARSRAALYRSFADRLQPQ